MKNLLAEDLLNYRNFIRASILFLLAVVLLAWYWRYGRTIEPIECLGDGPDIAVSSPLPPIYLQGDPRWGNHTIGGSGETLASVGCTICSLSMALAWHGIDLPPDELNRRLKAKNGYTGRGW